MTAENERVDDLQLNGYRIIQSPGLFRFGADAVGLANFARAKAGERVLDMGTGTGVIPILMCAKTKARHFTGLEIQPQMADMARRSVALNGLEARITIDCGDIKEAAARYGPAVFDVITVNPPHLNAGRPSPVAAVALARHELACTLTDVAEAAAQLLRFGGRLYLAHRPHRLVDVLCALRAVRLEPKRLRLAGRGLVLVEAALGGRAGLVME